MPNKRVHFHLDEQVVARARIVAKERGQTLSEWVRGLVADALQADPRLDFEIEDAIEDAVENRKGEC